MRLRFSMILTILVVLGALSWSSAASAMLPGDGGGAPACTAANAGALTLFGPPYHTYQCMRWNGLYQWVLIG